MTKFFKPLTDDIVFNHVFSNKEYALDFIKEFLNLEENLKGKIRYQYVINSTEYHDKKLICDITVILKNMLVNIEMYSNFNLVNVEKSKQYGMRLYGTQIKRGKKYHPKPVIQINLCKKCEILEDDLINQYGILSYKTGKPHTFGKDFNIFVICLDKIMEEKYNVGVSYRMIKYFKMFNATSLREMKKIAKGDEILMSIEQCVDEFLNDKETIKLFDRELWKARENRYEGKKEGLEQGKKEGLEQGKKEGLEQGLEQGLNKVKSIAKNLLNEKVDFNIICKTTGLTEQEVLKLQKTL